VEIDFKQGNKNLPLQLDHTHGHTLTAAALSSSFNAGGGFSTLVDTGGRSSVLENH